MLWSQTRRYETENLKEKQDKMKHEIAAANMRQMFLTVLSSNLFSGKSPIIKVLSFW
jgi:hypothetical protein